MDSNWIDPTEIFLGTDTNEDRIKYSSNNILINEYLSACREKHHQPTFSSFLEFLKSRIDKDNSDGIKVLAEELEIILKNDEKSNGPK